MKLNLLVIFSLFIFNNLLGQNFIQGQLLPIFTNTQENRVKLVDLDNDGDLDLLRLIGLIDGYSPTNANEVWVNDGFGNFTFWSKFGYYNSKNCDFGDVDNDGDIDIFVCNYNGNFTTTENRVWLNNGAAVFNSNGQSLLQNGSFDCLLRDFDGDGDLDAAVANHGNSNYEDILFLNDGSGQFTASTQYISTSKTAYMKAADLDNDGDLDIIRTGSLSNSVLLNNGTGVFTNNGQNIGNSSNNGAGPMIMTDVNADGYVDVITHQGNNVYSQYLGGLGASFSFDKNIHSAYIQDMEAADFDGDNDPDILLITPSSPDSAKILINDGSGNYTQGKVFNQSYTFSGYTGDIDADGDNDIILHSINGPNTRFWINQQVVSIEDKVIIDEEIILFPNPTTNFTTIKFKKKIAQINLFIYDFYGKQVYTDQANNKIDIEFNLSHLISGIYYVKVIADEYTKVLKLIKQ